MPDIPFPANMSQIVAQRPVRKEAMPTTPATSTKAMSDFFAAFSNEGQKWYGLLKEREAEDQFRQAQVDTMEMFSSYQQNLLENPDTADTDLSIFNKVMGESLQQTKQNLTNGKAARQFGFWVEPQRIRMSDWAAKNAFASSTRIAEDQELARFNEMIMDIGVKDGWEAALSAATNPKVLKEMGITAKDAASAVRDVKTLAAEREMRASVKSDKSVQSHLFETAMDIDVSDVSLPEYREMLDKAYYGEEIDGKKVYTFGDMKSDVPLLDDADYEELSDQALTETAGMIKSAHTRARDLIVAHPDDKSFENYLSLRTKDMDAAIAALMRETANEERQYQFAMVQKYDREVALWYAENKDKSGKEIYSYLEGKKWEYFNMAKEGIERMKSEVAKPIEEEPTAEELRQRAKATTDIEQRKKIYEQGKQLGYWE